MKKRLHSTLRKCLFLLIVALTSYFSSYSQLSAGNYFEAGFTAGPMVFLGDLGGHFGRGTSFLKDYNMKATRLSFGAFIAAHPNELLGFRLALNYGQLDGDDSYIKGKGGLEQARQNRNLDFRSQITEAFFAMEVYPTVLLEDDPTSLFGRLRPYGLIGVGVFHFNPQGTYTDPNTGGKTWVDLQPLHTEGEGFPQYPDRPNYSLTQINIPMGVGVKYFLSESVNLSFEIVHRKTFTDYIDDVSTTFVDPNLFYANLGAGQAQIADVMSNKSPLRSNLVGADYGPGGKRGDTGQKDAYFTAAFKIGIRLGSSREWDNSTRCPLLRF
ncbi:MAG TPA: hypothetical protein VK543_05230 [Puia sp.]|nr:hypothetical protein [Puia sp.]